MEYARGGYAADQAEVDHNKVGEGVRGVPEGGVCARGLYSRDQAEGGQRAKACPPEEWKAVLPGPWGVTPGDSLLVVLTGSKGLGPCVWWIAFFSSSGM